MQAWHFSENAYHLLPDAKEYDSIRVTLPNRYYDPQIGADLYHRFIDEWLIADELGLEVMVNEHHQTATNLNPAGPIIMGILARETKRARLLILGNPIANRVVLVPTNVTLWVRRPNEKPVGIVFPADHQSPQTLWCIHLRFGGELIPVATVSVRSLVPQRVDVTLKIPKRVVYKRRSVSGGIADINWVTVHVIVELDSTAKRVGHRL